jgi:DNA-binding transcriptional MerR regulator
MILKLDLLSKKTGVSKRAIRYYIQRKLLSPPEGKLKGAYYTEKHLKELLRIKELTEQGVPLEVIREYKDKNKLFDKDISTFPEHPVSVKDYDKTEYEVWKRFYISDGIEMHLRSDIILQVNMNELKENITKTIKKYK